MAKSDARAFFAQSSGDYTQDVKNGIIWKRIGKRRSNELAFEILHKQFIRKNRLHNGFRIFDDKYQKRTAYLQWRRMDATLPSGRGIYVIHGYNPSTKNTLPYAKDVENALGIAQFFNGQSPTAQFKGDPGQAITMADNAIISSGVLTNEFQNEFWYSKNSTAKKIATLTFKPKTWQTVRFYFYDHGFCYMESSTVAAGGSRFVDVWKIPIFYADDDTPMIGVEKFLEIWNTNHEIEAWNNPPKQKWYKKYLPFILAITAFFTILNPIVSGALQGTVAGAIVGAGAVISAYGTLIYLKGVQYGSKTLMKIGSAASYAGGAISAFGGVYAALSPSAVNASASTLPNYSLANSQNLSQTSSLYDGISPASWANGSGSTASSLYQNTNSVMFSSEANSFSSALRGYNTGATASGITSANSSLLYLTKGLEVAKFGFKSYEAVSNLISAFRAPNEFKDDDIPQNNNEGGPVSVSSMLDEFENAGYNVRRFYDRDVEYDLGLESGTLMSNDGSLLGG